MGDATCTSFNGKDFPCHKIKFTVTEGDPVRFNIGQLEGPFRIGAPFSIPLEFTDEKRHPTKPVKDLQPEISADGLDITFDEVTEFNLMFMFKTYGKGNDNEAEDEQ